MQTHIKHSLPKYQAPPTTHHPLVVEPVETTAYCQLVVEPVETTACCLLFNALCLTPISNQY